MTEDSGSASPVSTGDKRSGYWAFSFKQFDEHYTWRFLTKEEADRAWAMFLLAASSLQAGHDADNLDSPQFYTLNSPEEFEEWTRNEIAWLQKEDDEPNPELNAPLRSGTDASAAPSSRPGPTTGVGSTGGALGTSPGTSVDPTTDGPTASTPR